MKHREDFYNAIREDFYNAIREDIKEPKPYIPEKKHVKLLPRDLEKWDGNKYKGELRYES